MFNIIKFLCLVLFVEIFIPQKAYAYLDPGTGSMIIQVIIATFASVGCTLAIYRDKIINFFKKGKTNDNDDRE